MIDLKNLTIKVAHAHLIEGDFSAVDLTRTYLENIKKLDPEIHAYLEVFDDAIKQAEEADRRIKAGEVDNMLLGIPFAIKDNILIEGRIATSGSKILENYKATYDSFAVSRLREKGVIFLGRTNMDEFAMGGSTENSAYGFTRNPNDLSRVPGGTSGGSAAAVAGGMALAALGSDTGGSIRQPASFCGVVGLKGTYGSVSRSGLMAAVSSFDQIGPITNTTEDAEIIFDAISGIDPLDSTSIEKKEVKNNLKKKIGIPSKFIKGGGIDMDVLKIFEESVERFKKLGYEIIEIDLPSLEYSLSTYYIINFAEISSNMARYDGVKYGEVVSGENLLEDYKKTRGSLLGKEVRRRILLGTYVLSSGYYDAYYGKANNVRNLIRKEHLEILNEIDAILTPVAPTPAFKIGEKITDPLTLYLEDIFTVTANLTGLPALSLSAGKIETDGKSLPVGIQLLGGYQKEDMLFEIGKDFEKFV